jgi:hypothetical protein
MKAFFLIFSSVFFLVTSTCNKQMDASDTFQAKLVASFCAYDIVEIQDAAFFDKGMNWTNSTGTAYKNVFAVKNHCDFAKAGIHVGDVFTCRILSKDDVQNCMVCMGFMETPPLRHNIDVVK